MNKKILVTGGAGFIGSHLVDLLVDKGHDVTVFDNLDPQVHGINAEKPKYLPDSIQFIQGDVRNYKVLENIIKDHEVIYHLAASVGVGQSMYQINKYTDTNMGGTGKLLDILVNKQNNVEKLIVASSNTVYGEGKYACKDCGEVYPSIRTREQMNKHDWELNCPNCGLKVKPIPTDEDKPFNSTSIYALGKEVQEKQCLMIGKTYGINTTALRFFLVYGSRQALSNPYTGVCAIFSSALLNNKPPLIYEDGQQSRDFVHVKDICQALILSMENPRAKNNVFNVGTGNQISINKVAKTLANYINPAIKPIISQKFRPGDIRHCFPDISKISNLLGYKPKYSFETGIKELINWVKNQTITKDKSSEADKELKDRGLL